MGCNGYEIFDLGVMVPAERIVEEAQKNSVDIIILSGLITPSLDEMINVVKELEKAQMSTPVLIAGATTSPLHTALKIAPEYRGAVIHVKDVSQNVIVAAELLASSEHRNEYIAEIREAQQSLREAASQRKQEELRTLEEARKNRLNLFENEHHAPGCDCGCCK